MSPRPMTSAHDEKPSWLNAWHVNPSANKDYDFIDGLRGIAILMVVLSHHIYVNPKSGPFWQYLWHLAGSGACGTTLFFSLSGFLISWPFWKKKVNRAPKSTPPGYAARRFWKIYPPFALSTIALTAIYFAFARDSSLIPLCGFWLTGLPFVFTADPRINTVVWTLVIEVQFYLMLPFIFMLFQRVTPRTSLWLMPVLFLVVPISAGLAVSHFPLVRHYLNLPFPDVFCCFAFGILIAGLENLGLLKKKWAALGDFGLLLLPLTLLVYSWFSLAPGGENTNLLAIMNWSVRLACGCLLFYVADPGNPRAVFLCAPILRWCGIISYEWYLIHQPIIVHAKDFFGPAGGNPVKYLAIILGSLLTGLAIAAIFYRYFSLPLLKFGRSQSRA
jgi:peptidoglycan/LPS O-acetylase OafA/YrhL